MQKAQRKEPSARPEDTLFKRVANYVREDLGRAVSNKEGTRLNIVVPKHRDLVPPELGKDVRVDYYDGSRVVASVEVTGRGVTAQFNCSQQEVDRLLDGSYSSKTISHGTRNPDADFGHLCYNSGGHDPRGRVNLSGRIPYGS